MALQTPTSHEQEWREDLRKVGFVRRLLAGRRWYGTDWWLVAISAVMVLGFITLALFPSVFAPYSPDEQAGPRFLAPGASPDLPVLVSLATSGITELADLAVPTGEPRPSVGVVRGVPTAQALNDRAQELNQELNGTGMELRPRIARFDSLDELLRAVDDGTVVAAVVQSTEFEQLAGDFPTVGEGMSIAGGVSSEGGFILGTNQIGQDVFSRLIWGTRIALLIGFSASIIALVVGVPLGLLAGFTGGMLDRILSVIMDSLYAFPGLILAISITAVLGPSVLNVIVAIAVLYIPTYYRIVRGQTLSVKEELYIEAARSIGARSSEILRKYIYPNVIPSVAIIFSVNVADAILTGAGLSFLGLGLPPDTADWGIDLARGQGFIQNAWWLITFPGFAIMLVVLAFTMMGEGLMEIFNPKLRQR
ncbi:MAG: ABC transporter permease subunit [Acidimicrobiia bacterium]